MASMEEGALGYNISPTSATADGGMEVAAAAAAAKVQRGNCENQPCNLPLSLSCKRTAPFIAHIRRRRRRLTTLFLTMEALVCVRVRPRVVIP